VRSLFLRFQLRSIAVALALVLFGAMSYGAYAQTAAPELIVEGLIVEPLIAKLDGPTAFALAPDGRIYITQKAGTVRVVQDGVLLPGNFIDLSAEVNQTYNRGLVGITLHPDFPRTPWVYLAYVYEPPEAAGHKDGGARVSRVVRVTADPADLNRALPDSMVILLGAGGDFAAIGNPDISDSPPYTCETENGRALPDCIPVEGTAHQANMLRFGRDGALYVSVGDGGEYATAGLRAQDLDSLSGKILRINPVTGAGYSSNPFYNGRPQSNRAKVYAWGLRNPFRFAFHPVTGELYIGDVGAAAWEEVNRGRAGANFGWPCFEGPEARMTAAPCPAHCAAPGMVAFPAHLYAHSQGRVAIVGGDFYTGRAFPADLHNAYFFADYNTGELWSMSYAGAKANIALFGQGFSGVVQISPGPAGDLYLLSIRAGTLYRIRAG
jgi:glucose/arabinose dehydrogenase